MHLLEKIKLLAKNKVRPWQEEAGQQLNEGMDQQV
jgi:hypothetical protein